MVVKMGMTGVRVSWEGGAGVRVHTVQHCPPPRPCLSLPGLNPRRLHRHRRPPPQGLRVPCPSSPDPGDPGAHWPRPGATLPQ